MTQEDIMKLLDSCYEKCLNGIPMVSPGVEDMQMIICQSMRQRKKLVEIC